MRAQKMALRAVMFKSGNAWVGQVLGYDIAAPGRTPKDLFYQMERAIVGHMLIATENGLEPFQNLPSAPDRYRKMFEEGLKVEPPKDHVFTVAGLSSRPPTP